ncbi:alpha/beta hydrolase [Paenibacillus zanthoxyli]|uniref:alpha/beta hydrolase n=1 Tax=Paenibacillus zanthoxyli TaxID=369399 RepID=UPI0004713F4E|nr:alpha/beta hydrolase [Paenibacillus zanthoxyli]
MSNQQGLIRVHTQTDGYECRYRVWGKTEGDDVIVLLHGGISHSGWQAPLGEAIASSSEISFIAVDRRGSGLNKESRGDLVTKEREIEDVVSLIRSLQSSYTRIHLAGWCFGGQVASIVASELDKEGILSSFILIAPGFAFTERYSDVLRLSMEAIFEVIKEFGIKPEPEHAFITVPLQPIDFTDRKEWLDFIHKDDLRLHKVTERTLRVWYELADWSNDALAGISSVPVFAVFGRGDRLVDNAKAERILKEKISSSDFSTETLEAHHAVQFDQTEKLAELVIRFVSSVPDRVTT